jgi:hypothetical protein
LDINLSAGNTNDSKIFFNQLDNFVNISAIRKNNNNIFIGDAAYDSNNIRNKLKDFNLGNLVVSSRKKKLLKNRYKIEFTNNRLDKKNNLLFFLSWENMLRHIFQPNNIKELI